VSSFSAKSSYNLSTCDPDLQKLFQVVVRKFDCSVICGHRTKTATERIEATGVRVTPWPHGKHHTQPSTAVDVMPWPIDWEDKVVLRNFSYYVKGVADGLGVKVKWGGDFRGDFDGPHWELAK
jgi:hypothetical protein